MAAQIQIQYPDLWPETIRALVVHSANWPDGLWNQFSGDGSKTAIKKLLSTCGYGVPNLERALFSASNFLTLIAQAELNPFDKKRDDTGNTKSGYRTKDMHLYELPWPKEVLRSMPDDIEVEMRVTLSYFIEPGPGEIGWQDRYRYASHALRFDLKSPTETKEQFVKRINKAAREEEEGHPGTQSASDHWKIGQARNRGSIHSDIWQGTASELAESNIIAIAPRIGWWRERAHLGRWSRRARYSLVVSIMTPKNASMCTHPLPIKSESACRLKLPREWVKILSNFTEDTLVQQTTAEYLKQKLGWQSIYAYNNEDFGPDSLLGRASDREVVLTWPLRKKLMELNPGMPDEAYDDAVRQIVTMTAMQSLIATNRDKYNLIRDGVQVAFRNGKGELVKERLRVLDFKYPLNNDFLCVRELWVRGDLYRRRADIVGFVNGLPLLFMELKTVGKDVRVAYEKNFKDYKDTVPHLFHHNAIVARANGVEAKIGSVTSRFEHFHEWKRLLKMNRGVDMETLLKGSAVKANLIDIVENLSSDDLDR